MEQKQKAAQMVGKLNKKRSTSEQFQGYDDPECEDSPTKTHDINDDSDECIYCGRYVTDF